MGWGQALLLAVLQGLTEFLPVSSKSHLMVAEKLLGVDVDSFITLAVLLHAGTLLAVVIYYWRDWAGLFGGLLRKGESGQRARRLAGLLLVGTVPAAVVGAVLKDHLEPLYDQLLPAGILWLVTAGFLWYADRLVGTRDREQTRWSDALWVGIAQCLALLPGVSRSGSTIVAGLIRGLDDQWAPRFAFLLSAPIVLGATLAHAKDLLNPAAAGSGLGGVEPGVAAVATVVSAVVGYVAIRLVVRAVRAAKLKYFAAWCALMGVVAIGWGLLGG